MKSIAVAGLVLLALTGCASQAPGLSAAQSHHMDKVINWEQCYDSTLTNDGMAGDSKGSALADVKDLCGADPRVPADKSWNTWKPGKFKQS